MKAFLFTLFLIVPSQIIAARYDLRDAALRNNVLIISDARLERTVGTTNFISGWVDADPKAIASSIHGEIEFDLRSLETGLVGKDQKIREGFLQQGESPYVKITFKQAGVSTNLGSVPVDLQIKIKNQTISQKGNLKAQAFPANEKTAQRLRGNLLKLTLTLNFDLSPFLKSVEVPSEILAKKLSVSLDAVGTDAEPPSQIPVISAPKAK